MLDKFLCCCRLAVWWKRGAWGLLIFLFTIFSAFASAGAVDRSDSLPPSKQDVPCWSGDFATDEIDFCALLEQALGFLSRLEPSSASHLQKVASGFDPERSLRVQQALLREDLIWQNRGFSARQIDLMVFVAVALTVQRASEREIELRGSGEDGSEPKMKRRLERIREYKHEAIAFLDRISPDLKNVREYELKFYF